MSFASKLQEIRLENNVSQEGLAEMLGVSRQSVSKWERGKGYPEIDKLIFISERFGVSLDELLKEKKDASGNPRRTINLTKESPKSIRTEHPENSAAEEIYPERKPYAEEEKTDFFNHEVVSDAAGLARYTNYSYTEQNSQRTADTRKRRTFADFKKKYRNDIRYRRKFCRFIFLLSAFLGFTGTIIGTYIHLFINNHQESSVIIDTSDYSDYDAVYADSVPLRYMIDESTGTRYIFEIGSNYGLVYDLSETDISGCTRVTEISTGEKYYCDPYYTDTCAGILTDQNICYYIPMYLLSENVDPEFQKYYTAYQDINSRKWYFVPDWIITNADKGLDGLTIDKKEDNEVPDIPEQEEEIPDIPADE